MPYRLFRSSIMQCDNLFRLFPFRENNKRNGGVGKIIDDRLKSNFMDRRDRNRLPLSSKKKKKNIRAKGKRKEDKNRLERIY